MRISDEFESFNGRIALITVDLVFWWEGRVCGLRNAEKGLVGISGILDLASRTFGQVFLVS